MALFRNGTRVFEDISAIDELARAPWTTRNLQGHIDAPFVNLTPGTRSGLIHDEAYATLLLALVPLEKQLIEILDEQRRAEEEQASRELLQTIQRAFREAFLALPVEEYDWFDIQSRVQRGTGNIVSMVNGNGSSVEGAWEPEAGSEKQRQFFEFPGPLFSVSVSPASSVVRVGEQRPLRALPHDSKSTGVAQPAMNSECAKLIHQCRFPIANCQSAFRESFLGHPNAAPPQDSRGIVDGIEWR